MTFSEMTFLVVLVIGFALFFMFFYVMRRDQFRLTQYMADASRVELDRTRELIEAQAARNYEQIYREVGRFSEINHLQLDSVPASSIPSEAPLRASLSTNSFLKKMGVPTDVSVQEHFVFVLTPFAKEERLVYDAIRNTCSDLGLTVRRGDEKKIAGPILPHILEEMARSWLIVCNLNGRNPNVLYELGVAQALGKPVIMIAKYEDDLVFDLSHQQIVLYADLQELSANLTKQISRIMISKDYDEDERDADSGDLQEALVHLKNLEDVQKAKRVLEEMSNLTFVYQVDETPVLIIEGKSPSRQFITDVQNVLNVEGIETMQATLLSHFREHSRKKSSS